MEVRGTGADIREDIVQPVQEGWGGAGGGCGAVQIHGVTSGPNRR